MTGTPAPSRGEVPEVVRSSERIGGYCYERLGPSETLARDVHRLGVLCGPVTGLEPLGPVVEASGEAANRRQRVDERQCVRAAIASSHPEPLEVEWRAGDRVLARCAIDQLGWCPAELPLCLASRDFGPSRFDVELVFPGAPDLPIAARLWHRRE